MKNEADRDKKMSTMMSLIGVNLEIDDNTQGLI